MTGIKFNAGEVAFWLSTKGFKKGIIKSVSLRDEISITRTELKQTKKRRTTDLKYRLWCEDFNPEYMGDDVAEALVFKTYESMVSYYSKVKL